MTIETIKSPNPRNRNSISVIKSNCFYPSLRWTLCSPFWKSLTRHVTSYWQADCPTDFLGDTSLPRSPLKRMKQITGKNAFEQKKKKRRILKFNPGLALISLRTTGRPSLVTDLVMHMRQVPWKRSWLPGGPSFHECDNSKHTKNLTSSNYRSARFPRRRFFFRARQVFSPFSIVPGYTTTSLCSTYHSSCYRIASRASQNSEELRACIEKAFVVVTYSV